MHVAKSLNEALLCSALLSLATAIIALMTTTPTTNRLDLGGFCSLGGSLLIGEPHHAEEAPFGLESKQDCVGDG